MASRAIETRDLPVRACVLPAPPPGPSFTVFEGTDPKGRTLRLSAGMARDWVVVERPGYRPVAVELARLVAALADYQENHPSTPAKGGAR